MLIDWLPHHGDTAAAVRMMYALVLDRRVLFIEWSPISRSYAEARALMAFPEIQGVSYFRDLVNAKTFAIVIRLCTHTERQSFHFRFAPSDNFDGNSKVSKNYFCF